MIPSKQRGVSLVEMMVAVTIGLILMAGVMSIFFSSKVTYFANEKLARVQENGRIALNLVSHDVRAAGYMGCARAVPFNSVLNSPTSLLWNYSIPLQGFESDGAGGYSPALGITLNPAPVSTSDVIVARTLARDSRALRVEANMTSLTGNIIVANTLPAPVTAGQILIVTDCQASTVFQTNSYSAGNIAHANVGSPGNSTGDLGMLYRIGARVAPLQTLIYYVANDPSGNPALYRQTGQTTPADLLIEGVEGLQVSYGLDTNGDRLADQYVSATGVTNWDNVLSVNYSMLMRSDESGTAIDSKTYQLLETAVGGKLLGPFSDRRSRLVFTTTVALRNRAL